MKRVIALLLCLVLAVGVLAACGEPEEVHTHTYSESWTSDAEGHWYEPTCTCEDATIRKFSHTDANNDGACDVCTFTNHEHTYSEEWTVDCTNHWHAADCGHIVAGTDVAAHADDNGDGKCDVCNYVINDIHNHYYSTEWSYDETNHWHAALCEHGAELADVAAHNIDAAGYCTVCDAKVKEIDKTDIEAVLAAAVARNNKVIDGNVIAGQIVYGGTAGALVVETAQTNEVFYALGNGHAYIFYKSFDKYNEYVGGDHQYYEQISEDEVFGVQMQAGSYELEVISADAQFLNGYTYFPGSILPSDSDDTSTLANTLSALYAIVKTGTNVDNVSESYDAETGKYTIAYRYFIVNSTNMSDGSVQHQVELYGVAIEFSVDDNGVIDNAEFAVSSWRNWELDHDIDYDAESNTVTMLDSATPTIYAYSVSQRSGERTYTTPYPKASLIPTDFELSYVTGTDTEEGSGKTIITSEELIVDTDDDGIIDLELSKDEYVRLHLSSLVPTTAIASALNIDDFSMTFVNNDETKAGVLWEDEDFLRPSYSGYMDCIVFKVADAGDYTVTINFGDITKVINITVPGEQEVAVPENTATQYYVVTTDINTWADLYKYVAAEEGTYTFTLPAGLGLYSKAQYDAYGQPEYDPFDPFADNTTTHTVIVELEAGDTWSFYVGAETKNVLWEIGVAFVAGEVEGGNGDNAGGDEGGDSGTVGSIVGTYYSGNEVLVINEDGTMTFTAVDYTYTYVIENGVITYTYNNGTPYTADGMMAAWFGYLTFDAEGKPATFVCNGGTEYVLSTTAGGDVGGGDVGGGDVGGDDQTDNTIEPTDADGQFNVEVTDNYSWMDEYTFTAPVDGTYTFTLPAGLGFFSKANMDALKDAEVDYYNNETGAAFSVALEAGESLVFYVGSLTTGTYTIEFTDDADKIVYPSVNILSGENVITVLDAQLATGVTCELSCWSDGDYTFALTGAQITVYNSLGEVMATGTDSVSATLSSYREYTIVIVPAAAGEVVLNVNIAYPIGSYENPEVITLPATVDVNLPGNYTTYYYKFTATETGHITITYANTNVTVQIDSEDIASGASVVVVAGTEYTLTVYSEGTQTDTMSVAFEAGELTEADWFSLIAGEYYLADGSTLKISADGTLVRSYYSYTTWSELFSYTYTSTLTVADDGTIAIVPTAADSSVPALGNITLTAGEYGYVVAVDGIYSTIYTGDTEAEIEANDQDGAGYSYIAESEGTLTVTVTGYSYYDDATEAWVECPAEYLSMMFMRGSIALYINGVNVNSNTATTEIKVGDEIVIQVVSPVGQAIKASINVAYAAPSQDGGDTGSGDAGSGDTTSGSGTSSDPYVITELPLTVTHGAGHDVYYTYTVTADGTIVIAYPAGCSVAGLPSSYVKDEAALTYTVSVKAGDVISINPFTSGVLDSYTYTITFTEGTVDGGDDSGSTGSVVTYISARHSNGRCIKVEIDTATGTATLTRSDMSGGWNGSTATATCTVTAGTEVTAENVSNGNSVKVTFDANGVPTSITWGTATYDTFTAQ